MKNVRDYNVGKSDYAKHAIQPWDIILEYRLNYWGGDIVKRVLRTKEGEPRRLDYEKIIHICNERIRQIDAENVADAEEDVDETTVFCLSESSNPPCVSYNYIFTVRAVFECYGDWYAYAGYRPSKGTHMYIRLTGDLFKPVSIDGFPLPLIPLSKPMSGVDHTFSVKIGQPFDAYEKYDYLISDNILYRYMGMAEEKKLFKYNKFMGQMKVESLELPKKLFNQALQITCEK